MVIIDRNAIKVGANTGNILNINQKKCIFRIFLLRGFGKEKIGGKMEFFTIFCIFFTKNSIKQTNISMKVDNLVEHINSEKLFKCT